MMKKKLSKIVVSVVFLIGTFFVIVSYINKISYSAMTTLTRKELQDMVVATAYSYLNNKRYSEYDRHPMEAPASGDLTATTMNWRNINVSPEAVSRSNFYHIDCSSFASIVYKYSLGYDFSDYYSKTTSYFYRFNSSTKKFEKVLMKNSKTEFNNGTQYYGKSLSTGFFTEIGKMGTSESIVVYHSNYMGNVDSTINELKSILQPGDILVYRKESSNGHAMVYVGNLMDNNTGFIHSTGADYEVDGSTLVQVGDDDNSVRYDGMNEVRRRFEKAETDNDNIKTVTILRPINAYCTSDNSCKIDSSLEPKLRARLDLLGLRVEEYVRSENPTIYEDFSNQIKENLWSTSKYNSVNIGDTLQYSLYLKNNSKIEFCYGWGGYNTKKGCEDKGYVWKTSIAPQRTFSGLNIIAVLPDNVDYVSNSCTGYSCSYNSSNRTITWKMGSSVLENSNEKTLRFKVKVKSGSSVVFNGFKVNGLQMDKILTNVNPTMNKINAELMKNNINNFKNLVDKGNIKYIISGNSTYRIDLGNIDTTANVSQYGFIKSIYWNSYGIDMSYLIGSDIREAIFNVDSNFNYAKKTEEEIKVITDSNAKKINQMLVKGFYGGRYLRGNDNKDRIGRLRMSDLEFGDIIIYYYTSSQTIAKSSSAFMYIGTDVNATSTLSENENNSYFVRFTSNGVDLYTMNSSKSSYTFFNELYSKDLFLVLRPTQLYGTTVKYSGATIKDESLSVEYGKYRNLIDPVSTKQNTLILNYNSDSYNCSNCDTSYVVNKTFGGWYSDNSYANKVVNGSNLTKTSTHTLYAKWNNSHVVLPKPTVVGYTLDGWYSEPEFVNNVGGGGSSYVVKSDQVLYAKWKPNTYKIKYVSNGGIGTMDNSIHTYNISSSLNVNKFSKDGYNFKGWSKEKDGSVIFQDGAIIENLTTGTGTITLYAIWEKMPANNVTVKLVMKNGTADFLSKNILKGNNVEFIINAGNGYNKPTSDCKNSTIDGNKLIVKNVTKNITCNIVFEPIKYKIKYNSNGGTGNMNDSVFVYGEKNRLVQNKYTKNGYKFLGWSNILGGEVLYNDLDSVLNLTDKEESINLYAVWETINYKITYQLDGGGLDEVINTYNIESNDIELPTPSKRGYSFIGWTGSNGNKPQKRVIITKGNMGDKKYKANYESGKYTITYKSDSYGTITGQTEEIIEYQKYPTGTTYISNQNYNVLKWFVNKNVRLKDGTIVLKNAPITMEQIKNIIVEEDLVITLYHYYDGKYLVSYLDGDNGRIVGIKNEEVAKGANPLGTDIEFYNGFEFDYWVADKDVKLLNGEFVSAGNIIYDVATIIVNENIVLKPVYKIGQYVITYISDENSEIEGSNIELIMYPNKINGVTLKINVDDYVFDYWYANKDVELENGEIILFGDPIKNEQLGQINVSSNIIFTAKTKKAYYYVYYVNSKNSVVTKTLEEKVLIGDFIKGPKVNNTDNNKQVIFKCNKDVLLSNGEKIKAFHEINLNQLNSIVLNEDVIIELSYKNINSRNKMVILIFIGVLIIIMLIIAAYFICKKTQKYKQAIIN